MIDNPIENFRIEVKEYWRKAREIYLALDNASVDQDTRALASEAISRYIHEKIGFSALENCIEHVCSSETKE